MGVSVLVMPLQTWLVGDFRTTWGAGEGTASAPRRRRSADDAERLREEFLARLEPLLGRRPDWDEGVPARSATAYSAHAFWLPFQLARRWSYRLKLPQLSALESPQLWIPSSFESVFHLEALWGEEGEVMIGSLPRLLSELDLLIEALASEEAGDWSELTEGSAVARSLREAVRSGLEHRVPVIVEG
ncbi:MAG: hypothetical protein JO332_11985 [Planctomycetaceae bacterium]|nr:hypothetical protein [Planctomycetaceae bacterium]